ncbi:MAG: ABC transporter permease [Alphaproteobacteria bacterium]|nr:ABC transporter permease [Alphaproteobacteria bacterium]
MIWLIIKEAWLSLSSHKLRSFLTTLGIIIGVSAVVMMVAAGQTVSLVINNSFASMGGNLLMIHPSFVVTSGIKSGQRPSITAADVEATKTLRGVEAAAPIVRATAQGVYGANNWAVSIRGTTPDLITVNKWEIERGEPFTEKDVKSASPYVLIGSTTANELFGFADPVGQTIRIKNVPFKVVGLLASKGQDLMGNDQDDVILMPYTTVRQRIQGSRIPDRVHFGYIKVADDEDLEAAANRVKMLLRSRHNIKEGHDDDFEVMNMTAMVNTIKTVGLVLSILLAAIASISLIVGSIGIMNMMLVSVTERTREIGIRKALGAENRWIMLQFLTESIMISFMGSILGLFIGITTSQIVGYIMEYKVPISIWPIILSFSVAVIVGVLSGIIPAYKAMKLDPIEALRYQ